MPFAEVVESPHLHKLLLRGCSSRPHGKDTLCQKHAAARDKQLPPIDPGIACEKPCTQTVMSVILKFKLRAFVDGNLLAPSMQMSWRSILPGKPTATYEGVVRDGWKPASKSGLACGHAARGHFSPLGILLAQSKRASENRSYQCQFFLSFHWDPIAPS